MYSRIIFELVHLLQIFRFQQRTVDSRPSKSIKWQFIVVLDTRKRRRLLVLFLLSTFRTSHCLPWKMERRKSRLRMRDKESAPRVSRGVFDLFSATYKRHYFLGAKVRRSNAQMSFKSLEFSNALQPTEIYSFIISRIPGAASRVQFGSVLCFSSSPPCSAHTKAALEMSKIKESTYKACLSERSVRSLAPFSCCSPDTAVNYCTNHAEHAAIPVD